MDCVKRRSFSILIRYRMVECCVKPEAC
uniref:Uncharacterized protein n=1 Tax=Rhizophora mucronata TaxID=61149 RepID=A0A2P2R0I4_RHIMU